MGCCLGTRHHYLHPKRPAAEPMRAAVHDRAPPPPVEQEYVKEVLSETHLPKLCSEAADDQTRKMRVVSEEKVEAKQQTENVVPEMSQISEMSDLSEVCHSQFYEICSVSESFSTVTDKRDDEVVSKPSADVAPVKERKVRAGTRSTRAAAQSRIKQQSGVRRDLGEGSGRNFVSPVSRATGGAVRGGVARSPIKRGGRSGGRSQNVGVVQGQRQSKTEGPPNGVVSKRHEYESLESTDISLECFIFL